MQQKGYFTKVTFNLLIVHILKRENTTMFRFVFVQIYEIIIRRQRVFYLNSSKIL